MGLAKRRQFFHGTLFLGSLTGLVLLLPLETFSAPTDGDSPALRTAEEFIRVGRIDSAAAIYNRFFIKENDRGEELLSKGLGELVEGDSEAAARTFKSSRSHARRSPWPWYLLGLANLEVNPDRADNAFNNALRRNPRFVPALLAIARWQANYRKSGVRARTAYQTVVGQIEDHPTVYYEIGQVYKNLIGDMERATSYYEQQAYTNPELSLGLSAWGLSLLRRKEWTEARRFLFDALLGEGADDAKVTLGIAISYIGDGQYNSAHETFLQVLQMLPVEESVLYQDISLVANPRDAAYAARISGGQKDRFLSKFWIRRDPTPITQANERQLEHFRRVWWAREFYSAGKTPWDDRGDLYVRYGKPTHVMSSANPNFMESQATQRIRERMSVAIYGQNAPTRTGLPIFPLPGEDPLQPATGIHDLIAGNVRWESWVYADIDRGIEVTFVDQVGRGRYRYATPPTTADMDVQSAVSRFTPATVVAAAIRITPERYHYSEELAPLNFYYSTTRFRNEEKKTVVEFDFGIPLSDLSFSMEESLYTAEIELGFILHDRNWNEIGRYREKTTLTSRTPVSKQQGALQIDKKWAVVDPGAYLVAVQVKDLRTGRVQAYRDTLSIFIYDSTRFSMSDVVLAASIEPSQRVDKFLRHGLRIMPLPSHIFRKGQLIYVYFEVYDLSEGVYGQTKYEIDYTVRTIGRVGGVLGAVGQLFGGRSGDESVGISSVVEGLKKSEVRHFSLETSTLKLGEHLLEVTITDRIADKRESRTVSFFISE